MGGWAILVGVAFSVSGILLLFKFGQIIVHGGQKIESNRIGSKNSCK